MLIITRTEGESFIATFCGVQLRGTIRHVKGKRVKMWLDAPKEVGLYREEVFTAIQAEQAERRKGLLGGEET